MNFFQTFCFIMCKTYLYIVFCQKLKIKKINFYHIVVIISLVHAVICPWFWSDGSHFWCNSLLVNLQESSWQVFFW